MKVEFYWTPYRLFPYERRLGILELGILTGKDLDAQLSCEPGPIAIELDGPAAPDRLKTLTYFSDVHLPDGSHIVTDQRRMELSSGNGRASRQATRYSAHGLHEYRGKFNPQVVRAIGNIIGLSQGDWVLDPFCGSGTTLVESAHIGWNTVGLDLNPLAVSISNAKIEGILADPYDLKVSTDRVAAELDALGADRDWENAWSSKEIDDFGGTGWRNDIPNYSYLARWFAPSILVQLGVIRRVIRATCEPAHAPVIEIILSDILREVSDQDPADLRVRRRRDGPLNMAVVPLYLRRLANKIDTIRAARETLNLTNTIQRALVSDVRKPLRPALRQIGSGQRKFDCIITSPPYATALPYIDTQRLSLAFLGLVDSSNLRHLERDLIGTREMTDGARRDIETAVGSLTEGFPATVRHVIHKLARLAWRPENGFRKRNVPALVYQYFRGMAKAFENIREVTRPGGSFAMIVGKNRTRLARNWTVIDTPTLLADLAESRGWSLECIRELDAYQRYEAHQANSIRAEHLVILRRST